LADQAPDSATYATLGLLGRQISETTDALPLRYWRASLANRNAARANMLHIGDSITWGYLPAGIPSLANRWPSMLRDILRSRFPCSPAVTGGFGFMDARQTYGGVTFSDSPLANTGGSDTPGYGLAQNARILAAAGDKQVYTFTGTGVDFQYVKYGGGGTFSYSIDGGAATNVATANGSTVNATTVAAARGLAAGTHTLTLLYVSGGGCFLTGANAYNGDESAGIGSAVAAWPGSNSAYWSAETTWPSSVPWIAPALVTICLGANDFDNASYVTSMTFKANIQTIIATVKSNAGYNPSFLLLPIWTPNVNGNPEPWANYVQAMYDIAATDPNGVVSVLDLYRRVNPSAYGTQADGILHPADQLHPTQPLGNRYIAETIAEFIAPR
jgi:lysophospholipase L1-like esterase